MDVIYDTLQGQVLAPAVTDAGLAAWNADGHYQGDDPVSAYRDSLVSAAYSPEQLAAVVEYNTTHEGNKWSQFLRPAIETVGSFMLAAGYGAGAFGAAGDAAAPTATEALGAPEVTDVFGTVAGPAAPVIDAANVVVPGSAAGAGAATIAADAAVPAGAAAVAAPSAIPSFISNAVQSIATSAVVTAVRNAITPPPKAPAPAGATGPAPAEQPSLLPLILIGGVLAKVLFFS